jgi:hypothetical protein
VHRLERLEAIAALAVVGSDRVVDQPIFRQKRERGVVEIVDETVCRRTCLGVRPRPTNPCDIGAKAGQPTLGAGGVDGATGQCSGLVRLRDGRSDGLRAAAAGCGQRDQAQHGKTPANAEHRCRIPRRRGGKLKGATAAATEVPTTSSWLQNRGRTSVLRLNRAGLATADCEKNSVTGFSHGLACTGGRILDHAHSRPASPWTASTGVPVSRLEPVGASILVEAIAAR